MIARLKMEGQMSSPVARQLLENIPEGVNTGYNNNFEEPKSEIER